MDVLAVMDANIAALEKRLGRCVKSDGSGNAVLIRIELKNVREARAAVAELVEALKEIAAMTGYVDCDVCTDVTVTARAALSRFGGA